MSKNTKEDELVKIPKKFVDFWNNHKKLMPNITFDPIKPGFVDVARAWNCFAQMMPEMCEDVIIWPAGLEPVADRNPFRGDPDAHKEKATKEKTTARKKEKNNLVESTNEGKRTKTA